MMALFGVNPVLKQLMCARADFDLTRTVFDTVADGLGERCVHRKLPCGFFGRGIRR